MCYVYVWDGGEMEPLRAPSFASVSASSLPNKPECAWTLCIEILYRIYIMRYIVKMIRSLSG